MTRAAALALALAIGGGGGWVFAKLGVPLPWVLGSMAATVAAALAGAPLAVSNSVRSVFVTLLGLVLGSAFTPEVLDRAADWAASLVGLAAFLATAGGVSFWVLVRSGRFDPVTAYFGAAPGGLGEMVLMTDAYGGDDKAVSLIHSMRIVVSVAVIPLGYKLFAGYTPGPGADPLGGWLIAPPDAAALLAVAAAGFLAARAMRVPAAALVGPMVLSAAVHLAGWTAAAPPPNLVAFAQVVLGASIGARFVGVPMREVAGVLAAGSGLTVVMLSLAALFAYLAAGVAGLPFAAVLLGFAPGGLVEMCLVSMALGTDTAFVSTHHLARIALVVTMAPVVFRLMRTPARPRPGRAKREAPGPASAPKRRPSRNPES